MEFFNVPMRAMPVTQSLHAPLVHSTTASAAAATRARETAASPMPAGLAGGSRVSPAPVGVSPFAWEMLVVNVLDAQRRSAGSLAPLREAVHAVVGELRVANQPWEQVYAILHGVVAPAPELPASWPMGYEMHASRNSALVAHMQSWADIQRLAEIEAEALAG